MFSLRNWILVFVNIVKVFNECIGQVVWEKYSLSLYFFRLLWWPGGNTATLDKTHSQNRTTRQDSQHFIKHITKSQSTHQKYLHKTSQSAKKTAKWKTINYQCLFLIFLSPLQFQCDCGAQFKRFEEDIGDNEDIVQLKFSMMLFSRLSTKCAFEPWKKLERKPSGNRTYTSPDWGNGQEASLQSFLNILDSNCFNFSTLVGTADRTWEHFLPAGCRPNEQLVKHNVSKDIFIIILTN